MKNLFATPPLISITRKLAAGAAGVAVIEVPGSFFRIKEATGAFSMKIDYGADFEFALGMAYTCPLGTGFRMLTVTNLTAAENVVEILISGATEQGVGTITDDRLNLIYERGALQVYESPTLIRSLFAGQLDAGATFQIPRSNLAGDLRRKAVMVYNGSSELRLDVLDEAGAKCAFVPFEQGHTFPVTHPMGVRNPHGSAVECYVSEIVWSAQA